MLGNIFKEGKKTKKKQIKQEAIKLEIRTHIKTNTHKQGLKYFV